MRTRQHIESLIKAAFRHAQMPETETALTSGGIDGPYVVKHFFGKSRAEIEDDFMDLDEMATSGMNNLDLSDGFGDAPDGGMALEDDFDMLS